MRIAISGSHRTGKSTLLASLAELLPTYETVEEPYFLMEEDGHEFSHPPSLEDFVAQLERSIDELSGGGAHVLFDRCPVDLLAYILTHEDAESFDLDEWLPRIREALKTLDCVVLVGIESPDRVAVLPSDDEGPSREEVDEKMLDLLVEDSLDLNLDVLRVQGDVQRRTHRVLEKIGAGTG